MGEQKFHDLYFNHLITRGGSGLIYSSLISNRTKKAGATRKRKEFVLNNGVWEILPKLYHPNRYLQELKTISLGYEWVYSKNP